MLDKTQTRAFKVRDDEPDYARVPQVEAPQKNRYGKAITLVTADSELAGKSLNINGDGGVSDNPNRYKQHGFYFNADHCIACHACESACSEKNDLSPHVAFRSVGYVEGGTWPDYHRMNISMACNHCDDPVCLKGCPTRAYTKFAEYGAVLQDPDICFGCGYCTWVCPYNAPQLDPVKGHVEKCNMCVDRLEVGLKPACASACLAGALDFGIIETRPENRDQLSTTIPGFPTPAITQPNIRFQQKKSLPREMTRTDSMPIRYERDEQGRGEFHTKVHDTGKGREWNLRKLRSREDPLVIFTLISQAVVGAFAVLFLGPMFGLQQLSVEAHPIGFPVMLLALLGLETLALFLSTMHLGKPQRFYRAFNNLRYSPVSREVAAIAVFYNLLGAYTLMTLFPGLLWLPEGFVEALRTASGWMALVAGPVALYFMHKIYRIQARPFWNHWQVLSSFYGSMLVLGPLAAGLVFAALEQAAGHDYVPLLQVLSMPMLIGLLIEATGLWRQAGDMHKQGGEGAASHYEQTTTFGNTYRLRNAGLALSVLAVAGISLAGLSGVAGLVAWTFIAASILITAVIGRALFYVLVIPTTMPGAFFWKNKGFQEHARETGLANMPQTGVVPDAH
ncbi:DmsC/YnfH family molybdoenzyme membrane anchor subunit [Sulfuriflexus mobilis]|uniref:DmsC/YnfH family molybdoenzyme membrane anchor subunit n=1 Tax=Sulfuriflexus mobilis TaxID=1811807 RepID=UPI000F83B826|nr:DmsC/YnfH family molybdoenzyme membrane anchor subunit [Sulfuriflexus mobilis]